MNIFKKTVSTAAVAGMLVAGGMAAPAYAQPQRGLINVSVEDNNILNRNDVSIGVAAQVVAQLCGIKVGPVAVLGAAVDRSGDSETVCETEDGEVSLTQDN